MEVEFFDSIKMPLPLQRIYSRLGYSRGKTRLSQFQRKRIEEYIQEAVNLIEVKGCGRILDISKIDDSGIYTKEGLELKSRSLGSVFSGSRNILAIGATAGASISRAISSDSRKDNLSRGVVLDAAASEITDASLNWIVNYFSLSLRREKKRIGKLRFSAGYGDFPLSNQKIIYNVLKMGKIGVTINESFMLVPEKSVTALTGIY